MTDENAPRRPRPGNDFSRLRQVKETDPLPTVNEAPYDRDGKRALFSAPVSLPREQRPAPGAVVVDCGSCGESSVLTPAAALALAVPSVHLPFLKRDHGSWMRCPACRRRTWVSVQIQL
jgi:hypothetical protein